MELFVFHYFVVRFSVIVQFLLHDYFMLVVLSVFLSVV